jgi:hypothetical protein
MKLLLYILSVGAIFRFGEDSAFQPSIIILPFVTFIFLIFGFVRRSQFKINMSQIILTLCTIFFMLRNLFEIIFFQHYEITINAMYWLNYLALVVLMVNVIKDNEWEFLTKCLIFNLLISTSVGLIQFAINFPVRAYGLSGTENHLAYQVIHVSMIAIITYGKSNIYINTLRIFGLITLSRGYLIYISFVVLLKKVSFGTLAIFVGLLILLIGYDNYILQIQGSSFFDSFYNRFNFIGNESDSLGRGYLRTLYNPQYFFYGASEVIREFNGDPFFGQIHSNFVSLAFCFGIPGLLFSVLIINKIFIKTGLILGIAYLAYSLSIYFYSNAIFLIFTAYLIQTHHLGVNYNWRFSATRKV